MEYIKMAVKDENANTETDLWTPWRKERVGQMEKVASTYAH